MKDHYSKYYSEYSWLINEEDWVRPLQGVRETQFALGNGFLGSRSILEEMPYDAKPGTYIAGLYDRISSQTSDLVNLPNPFNFKITADGEKLGVMSMEIQEHRRILNLRNGLLIRHTVFQDTKKRKYDYQSLRFLSMHDKNIGIIQIVITPLDSAVKMSVETGIDTSVYNEGTVTEGRKKHFRIKELGQFKNEGYLIIETSSKTHTIIFRSGFYYQTRKKKIFAKDNVFELNLDRNQTVVFTKVFYVEAISAQKNLDKIKKSSEKKFRKFFQLSFNNLLKKHINAWEDLWNVAEVSIWGEPEAEKNFRFNVYHLLICAPKDNGFSSIGAKALTGESYRGHIFWDTEIFLFPFYLFNFPSVAKNILLYRYKRLDKARENAKSFGYKGAMFPWESADTGKEETPAYAKDYDGKVIKIYTGKLEHHITADIAYAFYYYYNATHDEEFLKDYTYEVIFETARFWASRVEYNKKKRKYEINHIIGPDEFHTDVNNNSFTNMMAKWNLLTAYRMFQRMKKQDEAVSRKLIKVMSLSDKETKNWKYIASHISINMDKEQVIEQFDGYFRKRRVIIKNWNEDLLPVLSKKLTPRDYNKTQFVKQADVIMLLYLLNDIFSFKTKKSNYEYYLDRTLHKSSLSLSIYALIAIDIGDRDRGYHFFNTALHTDISNIHNNTEQGVHAACIGGTWQVLMHGFAGLKIQKGILAIDPRLPDRWRKVLFSLNWRGSLLRLEIKNDRVIIQIVSPDKKKIKIKIFNILRELSGKEIFKFGKKKHRRKTETYYL